MLSRRVAPEYFDAKPAPRERPYVLYAADDQPRQKFRDALLAAWREPEARSCGAMYDLISTDGGANRRQNS